MDTSKLWVISVVSNPIRYKSRIELFKKFAHKLGNHVNHLVVEMAFGDRDYEVTERNNPRHLQLRSFEELWHKENMINLGVQYLSQLDPTWQYVAWIDADIEFQRSDWAQETVHALQHYQFVQMFQTASDLGPHGEVLQTHNGFAWNYLRGVVDMDSKGYGYGYVGHPGYAWACRREAFDATGGLIDTAILGAGDHHMALALIGRVKASYPKTISQDYKDMMDDWQAQCERYIKRDIGFVRGTILHSWHGKKKDRNYVGRWEILTSNAFSPFRDIKRDSFGLWQLSNFDKIKLRDQIRAYFRSRLEDSIDLV